MFRRFCGRYAALLIFLICSPLIASETRALWAPAWDIDTPDKIDTLVNTAYTNNFNIIIAEVRYRGDALYRPDPDNRRYPNDEPCSYLLENRDFDPLEYLQRKAKVKGIEVHAWFTLFVVSPGTTERLSRRHPYFQHDNWLVRDDKGRKSKPSDNEGAFWDPARPEVQDYLLNVIMNVTEKYHPDGIHLDYIRYPGPFWGRNPESEQRFLTEHGGDWQAWKAAQVTRFLRRCYAEVKGVDPQIEVTTSVKANADEAFSQFAQDWPGWLDEGIVDAVYPMAYNSRSESFRNVIDDPVYRKHPGQIVCGLRAWKEKKAPYSVEALIEKIDLVRNARLSGVALFSYSGMKEAGFFKPVTAKRFYKHEQRTPQVGTASFACGYVLNSAGAAIPGVTVKTDHGDGKSDANGFWIIRDNAPGTIRVEHYGRTETRKVSGTIIREDFRF
jgi:uncharacterized lipoprotein YddW (UPF0748 family)